MASAYWMRVGSEVQGPFTPGQILEASLLGRLSRDSLISDDRVTWRSISDEWGELVAAPPDASPPVEGPATPPRPVAARGGRSAGERAVPQPLARPRDGNRQAGRGKVHNGYRNSRRQLATVVAERIVQRRQLATIVPERSVQRATGATRTFIPAPPHGVPPTPLLLGAALGLVALLVGGIALASKAAGPSAAAVGRRGDSGAGRDVSGMDGAPASGGVFAQVEASVAVLRDGRTSATGFLVERGTLVASAHAVRSMIPALTTAVFPADGGAERPVTHLLGFDEARDIAVFAVEGEGVGLSLASAARPDPGARVYVVANATVGTAPLASHAVSAGRAGVEVVVGGAAFLEVRASLYGAQGGGAVLAADGTLVGLVSRRDAPKSGGTYVVPARHLEAAVREAMILSPESIARLEETHVTRAVFFELDAGGRAYRAALDAYIAGLRSAMTRGANTPAAARAYLLSLRDELRRLETPVGRRLSACTRLLEASPCKDSPQRGALVAYRRGIDELRERAQSSDGADLGESLTLSVRTVSAFNALREAIRGDMRIWDAGD